ncbi:TetR family transcriptional regulator [Sphaerisporangium sp. NPDC005289]|uniref:TetR family transcriptional regulator n=1 Tax=Sphaerisporangium sp. NPDC005289 TaxID=3155247 RepID=UPI00339E958C
MAQEKLTRETVVEQALALADQEGVDAVTIRRLASLLAVTPMALYWHFKNKEELMAALAEHVLSGVTADVSPGDPWQRRLRVIVEAVVRAMRDNPCVPDLLGAVKDKHELESFNRATEATLDVLAEAGFTSREAFAVSSYLLNGVTALVKGCPLWTGEPREAEERRLRRLKLESMPGDRYPRMIQYGGTLSEPPDIDGYYGFGVDLLLRGVEAMAARRPGAA